MHEIQDLSIIIEITSPQVGPSTASRQHRSRSPSPTRSVLSNKSKSPDKYGVHIHEVLEDGEYDDDDENNRMHIYNNNSMNSSIYEVSPPKSSYQSPGSSKSHKHGSNNNKNVRTMKDPITGKVCMYK